MSTLPTAQFGKNGPLVPRLGFGLMGLSAFSGETLPDSERLKVLDRAYEIGAKFWDSAEAYGDNEDLIGKWFKKTGKRSEIFLATKFGSKSADVGFRNDPEYVREACEGSLKRLGVENIDLYYAHRLDGKTPIEFMVKAMAELKAEGKITHLGLCEVSAASLRRAHAVHPITAVQVEYSPFSMDIENPDIGLLETCRELGIAVVAYSPLGRGFLTGQYKSPNDFEEGDWRKYFPRFSAENFPKNLKLVEELEKIAKPKSCTTGQLTLAWLMKQGNDVFPIPGTRKVKYLEENFGALDVELTDEEVNAIRKAVESAEVHGERVPEMFRIGMFADSPLP